MTPPSLYFVVDPGWYEADEWMAVCATAEEALEYWGKESGKRDWRIHKVTAGSTEVEDLTPLDYAANLKKPSYPRRQQYETQMCVLPKPLHNWAVPYSFPVSINDPGLRPEDGVPDPWEGVTCAGGDDS